MAASEMYALVQVIAGPEEGLSLLLEEGKPVQVGRGAKNQLVLNHDPYISTEHAQLSLVQGKVQLFDLRSSNGSVIAGRRVKAHAWESVGTHFVLGSTPFHVTLTKRRAPTLSGSPVHVSEARWGKSRLVNKAVEIAKARSQMHLDTAVIFLSVLELFPEAVKPTMENLGQQPQAFFETWKSLKIFEGSTQWINNYLELQSTLPKPTSMLATPKVAKFLEKASARRGLSGEVALIKLLGDVYNLTMPLLDWRRNKKAYLGLVKDIRAKLVNRNKQAVQPESKPSEEVPTQKASVAAQVDQEIETILGQGKVVELAGPVGCGKSRILHRYLDAQFMRSDESRDRSLPILLDIRAFLTFHGTGELKAFLKKVYWGLKHSPLVGIDHFDELLTAMKEELIDSADLFSAIHERNGSLILATTLGSNLKPGQIHGAHRLDAVAYTTLFRQATLEALISRFERDSGFRLSADNRKWLNEQLWDLAVNFHRVREILDLGASRARDALEHFQKWFPADPVGEEVERNLFEGFLNRQAQQILEAPVAPPPPTPPEAIPVLSAPDPGSVMDFVYQVEDFIKTFVEEEFHLGLDYTDRSYSIRESGILTQEEKLLQLKSFLVFLLSSYRESFRIWFQKFWNQLDPQTLRSLAGVGNNPKRLWQEFHQRAGKIDMALAEDQFIEAAAESFRRSWREARRSQSPPPPPKK